MATPVTGADDGSGRRRPTAFNRPPGEPSAMPRRSDVPPETLRVSLEPEGVEVAYLDDRSVFYHGVPEKREGGVVCGPGRDVHVLITAPDEREGVMVYVNDRATHDDVLESTGVGRVLLDGGETASLFPGVAATNHGYRVEVTADHETARGRVFVFAEDEMGEASYELVGPGEGEDATDRRPAGTDDGTRTVTDKNLASSSDAAGGGS